MPDKLTNIGSTISVSASLPATEDVAGYAALTFTQVKGVGSIPEFGAMYASVTFSEVESGIVQKAHGEVDYGGGSIAYRVLESDAGQGILKTAMSGQNTVSVKIVRASGLIEYFQAIVMSNRTSEASSGNVYTRSADLQATSVIIEDAAGV